MVSSYFETALILILIKYSEFVRRGPQELKEKSWKHSCSEVNFKLPPKKNPTKKTKTLPDSVNSHIATLNTKFSP